MRKCSVRRAVAAFAVLLFGMAGCLTPEKAEREADETAVKLATDLWREQTGSTNSFDRARPADVLTLRIALEALRLGVTNAVFPRVAGAPPPEVATNGCLRLSLEDSLRIGARHNRKYQTLKEAVYLKALSLDTERYAFDTTFTGFLLGALSGNPEVTKESAEGGAGAARKFEQGSRVAGNMAVDVAKMIRDDWHSFGWTGDLTMTVPLLRESGRDVVREPLTQAERDLAYALMTFARYRQTYALSVAKAFFSVLEYAQTHRNSGDNANRLQLNYDRAEMMFKAGRMTRIELDQAKTDLLSAHQTMITTKQSHQDALDNFKMTLGLPPESMVDLDDAELAALENRMRLRAEASPDALAEFPSETSAMALALGARHDLAVTRGAYEDAERVLKVKADALRADLTVEGGAAYSGSRRQHGDVDDDVETTAKVKFSAPWDRRRERNAYAKAVVARDQARRTLEEEEDAVKNAVRAGYRDLVAARALYANKVESWKTANMRVQANDLFMQSGRSSMRDILEAESALLSARNAMCSAFIDWWTSELSLKCALGTLAVDESGTWSNGGAGA